MIGTILLVGVNLLGAYIPQLVKSVIDKMQKLAELEDSASVALINSSINWAVCLIIICALFMTLIRVNSRQIIFGIGRQIEFDLKKDIFEHLIKLEPDFFNTNKTGDLISTITNDVQSFRALGGFAALNILNTLIAFATILPLMYGLNASLTMSFVLLIPMVLLSVMLISGELKKHQEIVQEKLAEMSHFIEQNLSGIHIIKAYAQEEEEIARFQVSNDDLLKNYLYLIKLRSFIGPIMKVIASLGFILLLYIGGKAVIIKDFSLGDFAAYSIYIERLIWPVATLGWLFTVFYRAKVSSARIGRILEVKAKIADHENSINKKTFEDKIELRKLKANIYKNTNVGIVGIIGSGKSVLANKLMHLIELEDGEILIDGIDIKNIKLQSLRSLINLVPQSNFLFATSIKENIAYAKDLNEEEIIKLAKAVAIHDEIIKLPYGYETLVGERGVTLSGGQRQRIAIARALAINPEILIFDDALSSVDDEIARLIFGNIRKFREGKTTIFITHKIDIIRDFDVILVLDQGQIKEQGTHEELIQVPSGIYRKLLKAKEGDHSNGQ